MSDYYIALIYAGFLALGLRAPFVYGLGYEWVDCFYPQNVSRVLSGVSVALIMGALAVGVYLLRDRRAPPRPTATIWLIAIMAIWVTLTTTWAVVPTEAWLKWDWAFKTVAFAAFIPFLIRSRVQIEAFIQVFVFSVAIFLMPAAAKFVVSGSGYGKSLGVVRVGSGIFESSTMSAVAIMCVPWLLHLRRHSLIVASERIRDLLYIGYALACCLAAVATYARTAIIGFATLGFLLWLQSRNKLVSAIVLVVVAATALAAAPDSWKARMMTIETYQHEGSAESRIVVWNWTIEFAKRNPLGGGFSAYMIGMAGPDNDRNVTAFHSIYFEVLGEHGWPGLAIYLTLILLTLLNLRWAMARTRGNPDFAWCYDLARSTMASFLVILSCGAFVGIAFQPMIWYLFAIVTSISEYVRRSLPASSVPRWAGHVTAGGFGVVAARR